MTFVAIAFRTTGSTPSKGHFIDELLAVRADMQGHEVNRLHLHLGNGTVASDGPTLAASFAALNDFIGADPVVTHDGDDWKRFLRQGLKDQPAEQVKRLLALTVDVTEWAQRNYPRQRKDLVSLTKRLSVSVAPDKIGLERDALMLVKIAPSMLKVSAVQAPAPVVPVHEVKQAEIETILTVTPRPRLPFGKRLVLAWGVLLGDA
jgi:hypothetical protein